jgi:murein DD-endopeptidase MepM/ murein hydrolase activator NlpD
MKGVVNMNSPYMGKFQVTQEFKGADHDGLDLVGLHDKEVHSTVNGTVRYAGWENSNNHKQGFGQYVCVRGEDGNYYYFGHLSELKVKTGDKVKVTDVVGIEGYTGYTIPDGPGGSHCHYCVRKNYAKGNFLNVSEISGIPNKLGTYDDGYLDKISKKEEKPAEKPKEEPKPAQNTALHEPAMSFDKNLAGTYAVTPMVGLNVRKGAGMNKQLITTLKWDTKVQCFGYYTEVAGVKWFLVQANGFEGFVSSQYLVKR